MGACLLVVTGAKGAEPEGPALAPVSAPSHCVTLASHLFNETRFETWGRSEDALLSSLHFRAQHCWL